jgi:hypothetical protein
MTVNPNNPVLMKVNRQLLVDIPTVCSVSCSACSCPMPNECQKIPLERTPLSEKSNNQI